MLLLSVPPPLLCSNDHTSNHQPLTNKSFHCCCANRAGTARCCCPPFELLLLPPPSGFLASPFDATPPPFPPNHHSFVSACVSPTARPPLPLSFARLPFACCLRAAGAAVRRPQRALLALSLAPPPQRDVAAPFWKGPAAASVGQAGEGAHSRCRRPTACAAPFALVPLAAPCASFLEDAPSLTQREKMACVGAGSLTWGCLNFKGAHTARICKWQRRDARRKYRREKYF